MPTQYFCGPENVEKNGQKIEGGLRVQGPRPGAPRGPGARGRPERGFLPDFPGVWPRFSGLRGKTPPAEVCLRRWEDQGFATPRCLLP